MLTQKTQSTASVWSFFSGIASVWSFFSGIASVWSFCSRNIKFILQQRQGFARNNAVVMNTNLPMLQWRHSPSAILPDDLIVEIISWFTVKPLMKMKCVSKSWNTLISDPKFVKLHLNRSLQNPLSYVSYNNSNLIFFNPFSFHINVGFAPFSVNDLLENRWINHPSDPYYRLVDKDCHAVVGSCNGLVCLLGDDNSHTEMWLRLWNPATRTISDKFGYFRDDRYRLKLWKYTFGYDNSTDTYKIVALHDYSAVRVLSFGNNVWRNIQNVPAWFALYFPCIGRVHLDCTVNWLATTKNCTQLVIISLDLGTETYTQLQPPPGPRKAHLTVGVCVLMDSLGFYHDFNGTDLVIWKMTKFGDEKSWTQFLKLNNHNLQMKITLGLSIINLYENGDILVFTDDQQHRATLYNWRNSTVVKTRVDDKINWFSINNYVESLVPTC